MPSPTLVDVESLLAPISAESPVGIDLREDSAINSVYSQLRDARKAARAAERSAIFKRNNPEADEHWRKVLDLAPKVLKSQSKDLEIACWYSEALLRKSGFQGLRDSFVLIRGLIERYWDNLFPMPDEDGVATRVAALTGLNGEGAEGVLLAPMRSVAVTENQPPGPFSYWQYKQGAETGVIQDSNELDKPGQEPENNFTIADFEKVVAASSPAFYLDLRDDIRSCLKEYRQISKMLDERCGTQESPPSSNIINLLDEMLSTITHIAQDKLPMETVEEQNADGTSTSSGAAGGSTVLSGPIKSREDAFRQLHYISQFFRKTEPHSPISYVIEKAVKWGNLSLGELIVELIPDSNARDIYSSLTGVKTNAE